MILQKTLLFANFSSMDNNDMFCSVWNKKQKKEWEIHETDIHQIFFRVEI